MMPMSNCIPKRPPSKSIPAKSIKIKETTALNLSASFTGDLSSVANIKVTGNAKPNDVDLPETSVAFSRAATG